MTAPPPRTVIFLAVPDLQILDLAGPMEVFHGADRVARSQSRAGYDLAVVSASPGRLMTSGGLGIHAEALPDPATPIDTLVLPGGDGARATPTDSAAVSWIRQAAPHARRIATVCTGSFLAGRAGLLDGRRVATHWQRTGMLQSEFPTAEVDPDRLYLQDGDLWSSGGVTAGIDLALAMVEQDHSAETAQLVARHLVLSWRRPGGQSQYAVPTWAPRGRTPPIVRAQNLIDADPGGDHRAAVLAATVGMSERHFARVFSAEVGEPPARYVEATRMQAARTLLETDDQTVTAIAARCGFGTAETMRRTFIRRLGVPPDRYRERFHLTRSS
ncbi:Transcriptional regulator GlxA family, contains an amidase domain and an AraC-type DNA-binding HTH domain [Nakamurella panacisegetis]|uniref:Transcriptional regulator GlxA family, contains an amidase domain and an AraC-type DNA-binding HTH domain n=1 Tax=Nakamurella panacisegetis TaxID=1090615 RepID=A0A1H0R1U1_9ACTN|nr:helix-turn-helix domain-containing protein [Nakamurella panacisegetis]SDP22968.1 Transcriptional regulator GlxA family, contains an amidase domain and an AraC-type DNA-binding HTH domain [Nakamurella panacisegetis]